MRLFALLSLFFVIHLSNGLTLDCEFQDYNTVYGIEYTCVVNKLHTTLNDRTITGTTGTHIGIKSNKDVKKVFIKHQNCPYLPLEIGDFFPNLEIFYIMKSNVQQLMPGDLDTLDNLRIFDVSHNPIEEIKANVFPHHSTMKVISFYDCNIKKVERNALNALINLERMHFEHNACVDGRYDVEYDDSVDEIAENIYDKCTGSGYTLRPADACKDSKTSDDNSIRGELLTDDHSSSSWSLFLILSLALTIILNIVFVIVLIRLFRNNFNSNWHEMRNVLV